MAAKGKASANLTRLWTFFRNSDRSQSRSKVLYGVSGTAALIALYTVHTKNKNSNKLAIKDGTLLRRPVETASPLGGVETPNPSNKTALESAKSFFQPPTLHAAEESKPNVRLDQMSHMMTNLIYTLTICWQDGTAIAN